MTLMEKVFGAGLSSLSLNFVILASFVPIVVGFQLTNILMLTWWTFFAASGAMVTMAILRRYADDALLVFTILAVVIYTLSLVPIFLKFGILHDFSPHYLERAVSAILIMHIVDSLVIYHIAKTP